MNRKTKFSVVIASLFAVAAVAGAMAAAGSAGESSGNQLAGTWTVTVNRPAPLPPLLSLQVYTSDGSMIESGADTMSRSPQYASYGRIEARVYAATGLFFRFNPQTGAFIGKQKINREIELSDDGQSFTFRARVTIYDTAGNVLSSFPVTGTGERLQVEAQL